MMGIPHVLAIATSPGATRGEVVIAKTCGPHSQVLVAPVPLFSLIFMVLLFRSHQELAMMGIPHVLAIATSPLVAPDHGFPCVWENDGLGPPGGTWL